MDTLYYFHRWLLWIALIVLLCQDVYGTNHMCPQGQLFHEYKLHGQPVRACCYPTRCGIGEEVKKCTINGTNDTCQMCLPHYNQSQRTSSFNIKPCEYWPFNKDCKTYSADSRLDMTDWRTKRCLCNIEMGMKFDYPEVISPGAPTDAYCQRMHKNCQIGHEPNVSGSCNPCAKNYFKTLPGFKLCEQKTDCSLLGLEYIDKSEDATKDHNCSVPEPVTTPRPVTTTLTTTTPTSPKSNSTPVVVTPSTDSSGPKWSSSEHDIDKNEDDTKWPIIGAVIFVILVIAAISGVFCYRKRIGKAFCICGTAKICTDPEKAAGDAVNKSVISNGVLRQQDLTGRDKITNNNFNGDMHYSHSPLSNSHPNGDIHNFTPTSTEHGSIDNVECFPQPHFHPVTDFQSSRPGILRNGQSRRPGHVVHAQTRSIVHDRSIDSIGQEKLQVTMEANQGLEENEPLLVPEPTRGAVARHDLLYQNQPPSTSNSSPLNQQSTNPLCFRSSNGVVPNFTTAFVQNGPSLPLVQHHGVIPQVTFAPATGAATFTRSTSVIASPEGEVDEDEIEARVPRFSQLLPDGEESSVAGTTSNYRTALENNLTRADSPGRELTKQLRAPYERLMKTPGLKCNPHQQRQGNQPPQPKHPGNSPAVIGPVLHNTPLNPPDHCIMNLKEQELAESLNSSQCNSSLPSRFKHPSDLSETNALKTVVHSSGEAQQTELKTRMSPIVDSDFSNTGASANVQTSKAADMEVTVPPGGDCGQNLSERKRQGSGGLVDRKVVPIGNTVHNVIDRKQAPSSGGSNNSAQNTLERHRAPSGDQQKPCLKASSSDEGENTAKKYRYNRTVSFEEEETAQIGGKQRGHTTEPWQSAVLDHVSEKTNADARHYGALRSVSDPEQRSANWHANDDEETEIKCISLEYSASTGSSKTSVNSDLSGPDSNQSSPSRATVYRRSHSENAPSSSESSHKPPPRSMSEEKPQKMDRPIAKVKPMPASDNAVNQLPIEVTDDAGLFTQGQVAATTMTGNSSDESDHEHDTERAPTTSSTLGEDEEGEEQRSGDTESN